MIKSTLALASLFACTIALVASNPVERAACVAKSADYLGQVKIDTPVETLVAKSREYYPDVLELIRAEAPDDEYSDALHELGPQLGCDTIIGHFQAMPQSVPCYDTLNLDRDDTTTLEIAELNEKAKDAVEAYFACTFS